MRNTAASTISTDLQNVAFHSNVNPQPAHIEKPDLFGSYYDPTYGVMWLHLNETSPAKFTQPLVSALRERQIDIEAEIRQDISCGRDQRINYQVFSSQIPGVFSLGGDLELFQKRIRERDRQGLTRYARDCLDLVYTTAVNYRLPVTTISLVQGTALGGGMEAALANNVVIAERGCKMGLPEIMFNLFPGMGAYHLLSRRLPPHRAEQLILSGRTYDSDELYDMGLIDVLAEPGKGEDAVWDYIRTTHGKAQGRHALQRSVQIVNPLNYEEFVKVADIWVDAAFNLSEADLKTMNLLVRAQQRSGY